MQEAESTVPVDAPEVDSKEAPATDAGSAPAGTETAAPGDDTSDWTEKAQRRYDELTRERYEAAARADRAEYRLQEAERRLAEREAAKAEPVAPVDDYPTLESCDFDEAKHRAAVNAYYDKQLDARAETALAKRERAAQQEQASRDWGRKQEAFIAKNPDYAQKVVETGRRGEWACSDAMAEVIQQSEIGFEVSRYLAENAAKSFEIARLSPTAAAREIGRIEARLEAAKAAPPPVSKAPAPPQKIDAAESATGAVSTADPASDKLSDDAWVKAERAREARKARRAL